MVTMQYIKMKDSGVAWIGEIPNHWKTLRLKFASWLKGRIGWQGLKSDEYTDEGAYLITGTDFDKGRINWDTCAHITVERFNEDSDIHIQEGDLLITKDGTIGKVAIARDCPAMVSLNSGVMLIRNIRKQKYHDKYLYYILNSNQFLKWYELSQNGASTIKHLYQEQFYNFRFSYPPLPEQEAIAAYLDEKCAVIDDTIAEAKASIEEYKAWKASVIFEAVTKGLDPNAEMKDSGVEWIGVIPRGWTVERLKALFAFGKGLPITKEDLVECGIPVISYGQIHAKCNTGVEVLPELLRYVDAKWLDSNAGSLVGEGDFIFADTSEDMDGCGNCVYIDSLDEGARLFAGYHTITFRPKKTKRNKYLAYLFKSDAWRTQLRSRVSGVKLFSISRRMLNSATVILPPVDEQVAIVSYLDEKCATIDSVIAEKESLIAELETYKKSLIFETVTGKRRVS